MVSENIICTSVNYHHSFSTTNFAISKRFPITLSMVHIIALAIITISYARFPTMKLIIWRNKSRRCDLTNHKSKLLPCVNEIAGSESYLLSVKARLPLQMYATHARFIMCIFFGAFRVMRSASLLLKNSLSGKKFYRRAFSSRFQLGYDVFESVRDILYIGFYIFHII